MLCLRFSLGWRQRALLTRMLLLPHCSTTASTTCLIAEHLCIRLKASLLRLCACFSEQRQHIFIFRFVMRTLRALPTLGEMYSSEVLSGSPAGFSNPELQQYAGVRTYPRFLRWMWGDELLLFRLMFVFSPQEDYRAINSANTEQIQYSSCNRNKHTLLPTWKCPLGINRVVEWRRCCNYPSTLYTLDIYTGLGPSLVHCAVSLQNHFQTSRGWEKVLKHTWQHNMFLSYQCPVSVKQFPLLSKVKGQI